MGLFSKDIKTKRIFLDYASSTPLLPEVKEVMDVYYSKNFYNPSAIYKEGTLLRDELNLFRQKIARLLHASSKEIIFTSGGTESNNQAILGIFEAVRTKVDKPHFIISAIEHSAITEAAKEIVERGGEISVVPVDGWGRVNPENIKNIIKDQTVLVSVMLANNEIGVIEPISKISRVIKEFRRKNDTRFPYFHTDASQAANYTSLDITSLGVDLLTLDSSKIYGPKGIGILMARQDVLIKPIIFGGGQERGLRSGTENMPLIAGFTKALEIVNRDKEKETERLNKIKKLFISEIDKEFPKLIINTPLADSLPNIINISFPDQIGEFIAIKLDQEGIMVSTGSSCGIFKDIGGSVTIKGIGKEDLAESTIRFSFGRDTDEESMKKTIQALKKILFS